MLCFRSKANPQKTPILVLAPNAGHHLNISELLLQRCLKVDPERAVYTIDWLPANEKNKYDSINDIVADIGKCVDFIGGKAHLFTLCQGAWAGAIYTALNPIR